MINRNYPKLATIDFQSDPDRAEHLLNSHHVALGEPVLLNCVPLPTSEPVETLFDRLAKAPTAQRMPSHIGVSRADARAAGLELPLVTSVLEQGNISLREHSTKLWLQPAGNITPFHFDGNSLSGLNLQIKGRKRWTLVAPETPLPLFGFSHWARVAARFNPDPRRYRCYTFTTEPGDLLFIPRYWFHRVEALDAVNANLNWVYTNRQPDTSLALGRREFEMVGLLNSLPQARRAGFAVSVPKRYGLADDELHNAYASLATGWQKAWRLAREVSRWPASKLRYPELDRQLQKVKNNNFAPLR